MNFSELSSAVWRNSLSWMNVFEVSSTFSLILLHLEAAGDGGRSQQLSIQNLTPELRRGGRWCRYPFRSAHFILTCCRNVFFSLLKLLQELGTDIRDAVVIIYLLEDRVCCPFALNFVVLGSFVRGLHAWYCCCFRLLDFFFLHSWSRGVGIMMSDGGRWCGAIGLGDEFQLYSQWFSTSFVVEEVLVIVAGLFRWLSLLENFIRNALHLCFLDTVF